MKAEAFSACVAYVDERVALFRSAIAEAQAGANNETKSSAGDKHETGRAMAQLETEKNSQHLSEALKLKEVLGKIDPDEQHDRAQLGSLVKCSNGWFYLAIGAGKITVEGKPVFAVSLAAPIGQQLLGKQAGDEFTLNGRTFVLETVH